MEGGRIIAKKNAVVIGSYEQKKAYNYFKFAIDYIEMPLLIKYDLANSNARTAINIYGWAAL